jgi:hypothetical protein
MEDKRMIPPPAPLSNEDAPPGVSVLAGSVRAGSTTSPDGATRSGPAPAFCGTVPWFPVLDTQTILLLARKPGKLAAELPERESGQELGQERGQELRIELGKLRRMLHGKEPDKELT